MAYPTSATTPVHLSTFNVARLEERPFYEDPAVEGEIGSWFRAVTQSARGIFHWDCADRSPVSGSEPAHASAGSVTFEPGAQPGTRIRFRQTLIIVVGGRRLSSSGFGWVQREGGAPSRKCVSATWCGFPRDLKHWHGASPPQMTHIAIQETLNGKNVDWLENVSDEQYRK